MLEKYGEVIKNADLRNYNTYRVNSNCKYLIKVSDRDNLKILIEYLIDNNEKYFIIGNGSNIILPDYYDGVIIKLNFNEFKIKNNLVEVGAAYMINKLALETVNYNLKGLEWASGIPGTIGASIANNSSCYDGDLIPLIEKLEVLDNGEFKTITPKNFNYSYRHTSLRDNKTIILKAYLKLQFANKDELLEIINDRTKKRIAAQPLEYPSAGSVFRNPEGYDPAGKLIEDAGLKGSTVGGAEVSLKHANFIINKNNAKGSDIKKLIIEVQNKIKEKYNVDLILEQEIIS